MRRADAPRMHNFNGPRLGKVIKAGQVAVRDRKLRSKRPHGSHDASCAHKTPKTRIPTISMIGFAPRASAIDSRRRCRCGSPIVARRARRATSDRAAAAHRIKMSDDSYLRSLSSLSCGLLDGLCQAEDEEEFSAEEQLPEPEEEAPESEEEEDFAPRVVKPVSTPTPKKRVAVSRDAIETFKEHLRKGLAVTKHCSNGKTKPRVLFCDDACSKLGWQKPNGTPAKNTDLLPLRSVVEIRAGVEIDKQGSREDPKGRTLMGTPTLRKCIDGTSARRVFSFIFRDRTLDLEFSTEEECRRNLRLFKVLVAEASK